MTVKHKLVKQDTYVSLPYCKILIPFCTSLITVKLNWIWLVNHLSAYNLWQLFHPAF